MRWKPDNWVKVGIIYQTCHSNQRVILSLAVLVIGFRVSAEEMTVCFSACYCFCTWILVNCWDLYDLMVRLVPDFVEVLINCVPVSDWFKQTEITVKPCGVWYCRNLGTVSLTFVLRTSVMDLCVLFNLKHIMNVDFKIR